MIHASARCPCYLQHLALETAISIVCATFCNWNFPFSTEFTTCHVGGFSNILGLEAACSFNGARDIFEFEPDIFAAICNICCSNSSCNIVVCNSGSCSAGSRVNSAILFGFLNVGCRLTVYF